MITSRISDLSKICDLPKQKPEITSCWLHIS